MTDLDEVIEVGRKRLADLQERYNPNDLASGFGQLAMRPEEFEVLLVSGTESTKDMESLRPTKLRIPTVIHVTTEQLERMLNVHVRPSAPKRRTKQRATDQTADVPGRSG